jgi:DNA-binding NarL/FixJ family response regulator
MRILLVDDHHLVRAGLRELILRQPGVTAVDEAASAEEALATLATQSYDVLMSDINMPGRSGLELIGDVGRDFPAIRLIVLSMHVTGDMVQQALKLGAKGYLLKDAAPAELGLALSAVANGQVYLSPQVTAKLVSASVAPQNAGANDDPNSLPPRQREILCLIARGLSTKEIAYDLQLSIKTVETHRARLMDRLSIHDVAGLTRYAIRSGLVE